MIAIWWLTPSDEADEEDELSSDDIAEDEDEASLEEEASEEVAEEESITEVSEPFSDEEDSDISEDNEVIETLALLDEGTELRLEGSFWQPASVLSDRLIRSTWSVLDIQFPFLGQQ